MKAVICPVCSGTGKLPDSTFTSTNKNCHGCSGKGWVEVGDSSSTSSYWPYTPCCVTYATGGTITPTAPQV